MEFHKLSWQIPKCLYGLSAFSRNLIFTENPRSPGIATHHKLTTVQLSLQFSLFAK